MGLLATRWEAKYEGHHITVARNELTRGFSIEWDGQEIARRSWSFVGLGELHGTAHENGKDIDVHVTLGLGGGSWDGSCKIRVNGAEIAEVQHIR
jgi:hypothetical protein